MVTNLSVAPPSAPIGFSQFLILKDPARKFYRSAGAVKAEQDDFRLTPFPPAKPNQRPISRVVVTAHRWELVEPPGL